jgi:pimeloyl-ACP methyl ester carboxylesterase
MAAVETEDGTRLSYETRGSGPPHLLFMHGWAGSGRYFDSVVEHLDVSRAAAVTFDLRSHGESDRTETGFDHEGFARDAFAVADAAGADDIVVVGFSMSGRFAQFLPLLDPERVHGLILAAGAPASEIPLPEELQTDWCGRAGDAERLLDVVTMYATEPIDAQLLERVGKAAAKVPRRALEQTLTMCTSSSFADRLGEVRVPALVVGGRHDQMFSPDYLRHGVAGPLPHARMALLDCGHEIPLEKPADLAAVIEAFLAGLG